MQTHPNVEFFGVALGKVRRAIGRREAGKSVIHIRDVYWCAHKAGAGRIGWCLFVLRWLGRTLGRETGIQGVELLLCIVSLLLPSVAVGGKGEGG